MKEFLLSAGSQVRRGGLLLGMLALLVAWAVPAQAQISTVDPTLLNPATTPADTATVRKPSKKEKRAQAAADSAKRTERLFNFRVTRPEKAGFLAIIPGAGQVYNRKYWKLPIVYGVVGGLGYWVFYQQRLYGHFKYANNLTDYYDSSNQLVTRAKQIAGSDRFGDSSQQKELQAQLVLAATNNPAAITNGLVFARRYRDLAILLSSLGYGLQILDAVVDAHLHDFDVSDNLSLNWQPAAVPVPGQAAFVPGLQLTLRVK